MLSQLALWKSLNLDWESSLKSWNDAHRRSWHVTIAESHSSCLYEAQIRTHTIFKIYPKSEKYNKTLVIQSLLIVATHLSQLDMSALNLTNDYYFFIFLLFAIQEKNVLTLLNLGESLFFFGKIVPRLYTVILDNN